MVTTLGAIIAVLLFAGTVLAPIQSSYAAPRTGGFFDTSSLKDDIRDGVNVNLEHIDQHLDQENLCFRSNTCRQSDVVQNTLGNDNSVTGFADQSDNLQQSTTANKTTPTPTPTTASLTVIKIVSGTTNTTSSDFAIHVSGINPTPANFNGSGTGSDLTLSPGSYQVTEAGGPSGYTPSYSPDCSGSISAGQAKTCTITNTLQTTNLLVCKVVQDFNTGRILDQASAFTLQVTANNPSQSSFPGSPPPTCTTITLGPGGYQVREVGAGPLGADSEFCNSWGLGKDVIIDRTHLNSEYCVNFSQGCSGTIAAGETKTCTVTNSAADIG